MSSGRFVTLNTGHQMPQLGYGTWQAGPGEVAAGVLEALRTGYRHLDLAKVYGNQAEVAIGLRRGLAEIPGLDRGQLFITSKLWNTKHRPADVEAALDDTLAELQLDYLDLYLIHWPVAFRPGDETHPTTTGNPDKIDLDRSVSVCQTWKAMIQLPKSKVRSVGVSNFSIKHLEAVIQDSGVVPAVNQIERHPRLPNTALLDYCIANKIVTTSYSAFGNNSLGLPLLVTDPEIKAEAARLAVSPAQLILAWCQQGGHTVIPKSVTPDRIRENFKDVTIDDAALAAVARLGQKPQRFNMPCKYAPVWDVNVFDEDVEKSTTHQVILQL